jgi:RNA polymerase sigma-70 factor (sigma-E family)
VDARFAEYVSGQWSALLRYATVLCGDPVEAEELVQSALVRVGLRWDRVESKDNPHYYVRRAVLRVYLSRWRRVRSRESLTANVPDRVGPDPTGAVLDHDVVRRALLQVPPRQRAVLVLRYLEDMTEAQTADVLGCSVGTVKSQTSKGLARLRDVLSVSDDVAADLQGGTK